MMAASRGAPNRVHKSRFTPVWRRWEQAADALDSAEESEDFQSVGMRCRESLIQLIRALAKPNMVPDGQPAPKRSDVVGWSGLIANSIAGGQHNDTVRAHLKAIAKSTWDMANWLTHASGARRVDAIFVIECDARRARHLPHRYDPAGERKPERCPECGSYSSRQISIRSDAESVFQFVRPLRLGAPRRR